MGTTALGVNKNRAAQRGSLRFRRVLLKVIRLYDHLRSLRILRSAVIRQPRQVRVFLRGLDRFLFRLYPLDLQLRVEFNRWAEDGRAPEMERDHMAFTERALDAINLCPGDRILDLACGEGWACRLMAARLGEACQAVGLDISDQMVRRARAKSGQFENLSFICGSAESIPCPDNFFTKALSVEAFCYFEHQERVLRELLRVLTPSGRLFLVGCLYKDHPDSLPFVHELRVPVHVRSAAEYKAMLESEGWMDVQTEEFVRETPPGHETGFHDRALLISARKPGPGI